RHHRQRIELQVVRPELLALEQVHVMRLVGQPLLRQHEAHLRCASRRSMMVKLEHRFSPRERAANGHRRSFATRYSLLATRYSLLATRYSLLATRYSLLATRYSLLATRYSLLATRYSLLATRYSLLATRYAASTRLISGQVCEPNTLRSEVR